MNPKLEKHLQRIKDAGGMLPWGEAIKKHRQLAELGLVVKGSIGENEYAVLVDKKLQEELRADEEQAEIHEGRFQP